MTWDDIKTLTNQKILKDNLLDTKQPETPAMILYPQSAAKAFTNMLILLGKMRGASQNRKRLVLNLNDTQ